MQREFYFIAGRPRLMANHLLATGSSLSQRMKKQGVTGAMHDVPVNQPAAHRRAIKLVQERATVTSGGLTSLCLSIKAIVAVPVMAAPLSLHFASGALASSQRQQALSQASFQSAHCSHLCLLLIV